MESDIIKPHQLSGLARPHYIEFSNSGVSSLVTHFVSYPLILAHSINRGDLTAIQTIPNSNFDTHLLIDSPTSLLPIILIP